jgi:hypothetical protein
MMIEGQKQGYGSTMGHALYLDDGSWIDPSEPPESRRLFNLRFER